MKGAWFGPPKQQRIVTSADARNDEALIIIAGDMFAAGYDTKDIAQRLVIPEAAALAAVHVARERRRPEVIL